MECKTNVMRILDQHKIDYKSYSYADTDAISGMDVATILHENPSRVFKTLVLVGDSKHYYVFDVPVNKKLDLKKAAISVNEKSINMIYSKELLPKTGYIHGGCSPIGMKKLFTTIIDSSATCFDSIIFSGGKVGYQVEVKLSDLMKLIPIKFFDITKDQ